MKHGFLKSTTALVMVTAMTVTPPLAYAQENGADVSAEQLRQQLETEAQQAQEEIEQGAEALCRELEAAGGGLCDQPAQP